MREIDSKEYWRRREEAALKHYIKEEAAYDREIRRIYENQLSEIQTQINSFYGKYATKEGITIAEAKKRVSKLDIAAYERKAARYVKERNFSDRANEEMRIYNLTMKVNRLEMLKANIGLELISGHDELNRFMEKILRGRTEAELKRQAGILGHTIRDNAKLAHTIPNASFHHATFSDRIWMHQDMMKADLSKLLQTGLIQGKNPRELARSLRKYYCGDERLKNGRNGAIYNTERLMRTEMARVQTEAQKQSFVENGFKQYMFIANTNSGCCDECRNNDGKVFDVAKMTIGDNAPPIHPHCRCATAPYEDSAEYEAWLDYLDKGGKTEEWNFWKREEWEESKPKYTYRNTIINKVLVESADYRRKIDNISDNVKVNRSIWKNAKEILHHRTGTKYEDLAYIDIITGKAIINKAFDKENNARPNAKMDEMLDSAKPYTVIGIHNHPSSTAPSISDLIVCMNRKYCFGVVLCHDGKIYKYSVDSDRFNEPMAYAALDKLNEEGYNAKIKKMFEDAGIKMEVL